MLLVILMFATAAPAVYAQSGETTTSTTTTTLNISTSPSTSLGSITFKTSNSKRVEVGKSTQLFITIKDMSGSITTTFSCSNTAIATIEKVNNTCVKVYGLKNGEVVITATAGGKADKYTLIVGDSSATATAGTDGAATPTSAYIGGEIDYFSENEHSSEYRANMRKYIEEKNQSDALSILIGVVGWAAIIAMCGVVLSVIFRNRSPKLNLYPGSRRRFNTGGYRGNQRKRLLPDHYYRNNKKY